MKFINFAVYITVQNDSLNLFSLSSGTNQGTSLVSKNSQEQRSVDSFTWLASLSNPYVLCQEGGQLQDAIPQICPQIHACGGDVLGTRDCG